MRKFIQEAQKRHIAINNRYSSKTFLNPQETTKFNEETKLLLKELLHFILLETILNYFPEQPEKSLENLNDSINEIIENKKDKLPLNEQAEIEIIRIKVLQIRKELKNFGVII